jgi:hypothetical protein
MTAHELAKKLLEGPDMPIVIQDYPPNEDTFDLVTVIELRSAWQIDYNIGRGWDPALFFEPPRNPELPRRETQVMVLR